MDRTIRGRLHARDTEILPRVQLSSWASANLGRGVLMKPEPRWPLDK